MMGAIIKHIYAPSEGIDPKKIFNVSIMPCTAKKFEAKRPELGADGIPDVDAVLTTRELAQLIKQFGLKLNALDPEPADNPLGTRSTAGKLFGATGGVMEAALRTAYYFLTGKDMDNLRIQPLRGLNGVKEAHVDINGLEVRVAVVSGLGNARMLLDDIKAGKRNYHFIEVMTCPGGCIAGGGQPIGTDLDLVRSRMQALYNIDQRERVRTSHSNSMIQELYTKHLGKPLGEKSHHLLHTHYSKRDVFM